MLLRESNDHRRTDLATQQRILSLHLSARAKQHAPQPIPSEPSLVDDEGEEAGSGVHAWLKGSGGIHGAQPSARGGPAQTDADTAEQGEQGLLVFEPASGDGGQDPGDSGRGSILPCDHATFHGQPRLARDDSEQSGDLAFAVPALERAYSTFRSEQDRHAGRPADGEAEPDDATEPAQLPAQVAVHLVSPATIGISRQEAREALTLVLLPS